jgi:hypothetical protein
MIKSVLPVSALLVGSIAFAFAAGGVLEVAQAVPEAERTRQAPRMEGEVRSANPAEQTTHSPA